jgi:hypothetical protein
VNNFVEKPDEVWLLNLGYVSEHSEQNLMLYGYLSTPGVLNVEMLIDVEKKLIRYAVVLSNRSHFWYRLQKLLEGGGGLYRKLALLLFLRRFGSYDPAARILRCIRDYAGPQWTTETEVLAVKQYLAATQESQGRGWFFKEGLEEAH